MLASGMPSALTREDAARIAALAKLDLDPGELDRVAHQLGSMLEYFEQIASIETEGVEPYVAAPSDAAPLREDAPAASLARADSFANAPDAQPGAGLFRVPRVIGS